MSLQQITADVNLVQTLAFFLFPAFSNGLKESDGECLVPWRYHGSLHDDPA